MHRFPIRGFALAQVMTIVAVIVTIALWPPQRGTMLMIPLSGHAATAVDVALAGHASLVGMGPLPGSMIVLGDRAALDGPAFDRGILLLAAPRAICGTVQKDIA